MAKETMNLVIDTQLKRKFKSACVLEGVNMSDVVANLVIRWLAEREPGRKSGSESEKRT